MAEVVLMRSPKLGSLPATWSLWRTGTGPGRGEGEGFKTVKEAREWAKKWGHTIIVPTWKSGKCAKCGKRCASGAAMKTNRCVACRQEAK